MKLGSTLLTVSAKIAGLDSATTFTVTKWLRVVTHAMRLTTVVSLLQPAPEVFALFDDVLLLTDGCVLTQHTPSSVPMLRWLLSEARGVCPTQIRS